ncbi:sigma-E factor regulatory protein RseB domain-containing protein [Micromonospora sp. C28SCA-DRY-2]|uniref:LolA family protein n=1 Tax=Micromonospora sp. C28SCA-DRY-2 TaxID=3059522 RepID=UPI0026743C06|nr:sigma-E factor regulatory protein RseB domain-containing protein [Micromonospora sp. C28SCA-DRY-2]MDO3700323.1 sigma-E factor regulatory protein RseB domain-containing protein [Micromonospora sp. C28SCA-DRY-2]
MSVLKSRPVLRWLVPVTAAATVIGGGAALGTFAAQAEPSLPPRTAAELLVDLQTSRLEGLSGTVVQRADLGLPPLAGLAGGELGSLLTGTHTLRVWHSGPDRQRIALLDTLGEKDVIRNGRDVWTWDSRTNTATHRTLPTESGEPAAPDLPATPQQAADQALAAIDPSTEVSVGRSATVAGRDAYELVLAPRDAASLVHQVRIAIDAEEHVPLRFEVFADGSDQPAFEMAFTQVDYARPAADQFAFNPPPGVTITEESVDRPAGAHRAERPAGDRPQVRTVGEGWTTVVVARLDGPATGGAGEPAQAPPAEVAGVLDALPKVSGDWGSGRLLTGKLFSALLTDDGRLLAGAVTPERLYEVAKG